MKIGSEGSGAYFRINPPCPAFWGVAPAGRFHRPKGFRAETGMKIGRKLGFYFRINSHAPWGTKG
jgi:hypothetical protein